MCKQLLSILFPLNVLGKKKKCKVYTIPGTAIFPVNVNITWTGERLGVAYTNYRVYNPTYSQSEPQTLQRKHTFSDGNETTESIYVQMRADVYETLTVVDRKIYFNCTNVTSLIVNGETLI